MKPETKFKIFVITLITILSVLILITLPSCKKEEYYDHACKFYTIRLDTITGLPDTSYVTMYILHKTNAEIRVWEQNLIDSAIVDPTVIKQYPANCGTIVCPVGPPLPDIGTK